MGNICSLGLCRFSCPSRTASSLLKPALNLPAKRRFDLQKCPSFHHLPFCQPPRAQLPLLITAAFLLFPLATATCPTLHQPSISLKCQYAWEGYFGALFSLTRYFILLIYLSTLTDPSVALKSYLRPLGEAARVTIFIVSFVFLVHCH